MRSLVFAAATLLAAGAAHAEPVAYTLDPAHTQVAFSIDRFGFNRVLARFDQVTGELVLDEDNPENSSVTATIRLADLTSGDETRDEHLREERWLNAAQFPTIEFRSTSVERTGEDTARVIGDLTLLGQSHPVTLEVTLNSIGPNPVNQRRIAGFSATGSFTRSTWGSTLAQGRIGDEVRVSIEALAQAAQ